MTLNAISWKRPKDHKLSLSVVVACITFLSASGARAATVYDVSETLGGLVLTGTITTDGKIGILSSFDIDSFNLSLMDLNNSPAPLTSTTSTLALTGNDVIATKTTLSFNFPDTSFGSLGIVSNHCEFPCGLASWVSQGNGNGGANFALLISFSLDSSTSEQVPKHNEEVFATAPSMTPLPAAFPLFAGGLGVLGLLGWPRKRKHSAAIAVA